MVCNKCKKEKPNTDFYKSRGQTCKECSKKYERKRYHGVYKERARELSKKWQAENPEKMREYHRLTRLRKRTKILEHYGKKCACCGEDKIEFLAIDHINGGGRKQRKELGGNMFYNWLIAQNFPKGFQLLCHNCNHAKHFYGKCPHLTNPSTA